MSDFILELAAGTSRSGKSFETNRRTKAEKNVMVWDAIGEFHEKFKCKRVQGAAGLRTIAARGLPGRWAFDVPLTPENFDLFCRCAWLWIRVMAHRGKHVCLIVEELADVTPPGKAPQSWGQIVRKSLRYNPRIYALTQRPAESDKTVMGNATILRCHSMATPDDRRTMAKYLDVDQGIIDGLDFGKYQYIERDRRTRSLTTAGKGMRPRAVR